MGVKSEYQKHFKVSALRKSLPLYYENVAFRTARRDREYAHTPLSWGEEDAGSIDSDSQEDTEASRLGVRGQSVDSADDSVHPEQQREDASCKTAGKEMSEISSNDDNAQTDSDNKSTLSMHSDHVPVRAKKADQSDRKLEKYASENNRNKKHSPKPYAEKRKTTVESSGHKEEGIPSKTYVMKGGKPRRPDRKTTIPRSASARPKSRRTPTPVEHRAPFVSYGWADVEQDLSTHRTFNVKANTDVHPAAARAQAMRKLAAQHRVVSAKKSEQDKVLAALNCQKEAGDQDKVWQSEYQLRYPAYDATEYSRSLSARAHERKTCPIVFVK